MFIKIQTNRVKLREVITLFENYAQPTEILIAPRPLPKENFKFYVAYASVIQGKKNNKAMSKSEFDREVNAIKYRWVAGDKNV